MCVRVRAFVCVVGVGGTEARQVLTNRLVQHHDGVLLVRGGNGKRRRVEFRRGLCWCFSSKQPKPTITPVLFSVAHSNSGSSYCLSRKNRVVVV